ncbi:MAG: PmoA family protein [Balneolales bacterium]
MSKIILYLLLLFITSGMNNINKSESFEVVISAGDLDRRGTIISFSLPMALGEGEYIMKNDKEEPVIVQVDRYNKAWFILDELHAGISERYIFWTQRLDEKDHNLPEVSAHFESPTVTFQANNKKVLSYYVDTNNPPPVLDEIYRRGGYIHPVYSPGGIMLTNHLNVDHHPHHYGIWAAWTNTVFQGSEPDFWNVHRLTGRVEHSDSLEYSWQGPVHGGLRNKHHYIDLSNEKPETALNEQWDLQVYNEELFERYHIFDLKIVHTVNTGKPLILPEYRYGGMGFRGHSDWNDPDNFFFLTSEGEGIEGNGTRARWVHLGGYSDGELAGIAILGHPTNFRAPQTIRIHPEEPFFNFAPTQLGDMSIEPGTPYVARYRFITYDGEPNPAELDRLWQDYAYPPGVTVKVLN